MGSTLQLTAPDFGSGGREPMGVRVPPFRTISFSPHSPYGTLIVPPYITLTHYNYSRYNL